MTKAVNSATGAERKPCRGERSDHTVGQDEVRELVLRKGKLVACLHIGSH